MNNSILIILILAALIILGVIVYNLYQENRYRQQIRDQFGHANKDALLDNVVVSVRDGNRCQTEAEQHKIAGETDLANINVPTAAGNNNDADQTNTENQLSTSTICEVNHADEVKPNVLTSEEHHEDSLFHFSTLKSKLPSQMVPDDSKQPALLDVYDMAKQPLPWFDERFDYMAYIALYEPKELHVMPRLSSHHRFRLVGCTMDGRYQIAEPIPSVYYQGFVVGLQAVSRRGLASQLDLEQFGEQVNTFAKQMNGVLLLADVDEFLRVARPLDKLCERVDQTIVIHLVSRTAIKGIELRSCIEKSGFELSHDGSFNYPDEKGDVLFSIVTLDNTPFTTTLLSSQIYRGFSMLFDVVHVAQGEKNFNRFMDIAVMLSSQLGLDLVNDQVEELSTQWLKEIRSYVIDRQNEMKQVHIEPGSELAKRLFQ